MAQDLWRVVQDQESYFEKIDGLDYEEAFELNVMIEKSKPLLDDSFEEWDELIYTPFRYPLPVGINFGSRFKPPGSDYNLLYAGNKRETAFSESSHHFLLERKHLKNLEDETVKKTLFSLELIKSDQLEDVRQHSEIRLIMSDDYNHSYQIATKIMEKANGVIYPSARKKDGINFAIKNIELLGKETKYKESIAFKFLAKSNTIDVSKYLGEKLFEYSEQNLFS